MKPFIKPFITGKGIYITAENRHVFCWRVIFQWPIRKGLFSFGGVKKNKKWVWICLNYETWGYFMILHGICSSNMFVGLVPPHGVVEYIINYKSNEIHLGKCVPTL